MTLLSMLPNTVRCAGFHYQQVATLVAGLGIVAFTEGLHYSSIFLVTPQVLSDAFYIWMSRYKIMLMSFFALHDLCPSDSFTKYGLLIIYGKLLRSGPDHLGLKYFIA